MRSKQRYKQLVLAAAPANNSSMDKSQALPSKGQNSQKADKSQADIKADLPTAEDREEGSVDDTSALLTSSGMAHQPPGSSVAILDCQPPRICS